MNLGITSDGQKLLYINPQTILQAFHFLHIEVVRLSMNTLMAIYRAGDSPDKKSPIHCTVWLEIPDYTPTLACHVIVYRCG